jgi:hypothetical protein
MQQSHFSKSLAKGKRVNRAKKEKGKEARTKERARDGRRAVKIGPGFFFNREAFNWWERRSGSPDGGVKGTKQGAAQ